MCNTTLLSIWVKVRNINVDFRVRINKCLLTKNMYLVFYSLAPKFRDVFMDPRYVCLAIIKNTTDNIPITDQMNKKNTSVLLQYFFMLCEPL